MSLLLAMMCNFHCEESSFILNDVKKGFVILDTINLNKNLLESVNDIVKEAEVKSEFNSFSPFLTGESQSNETKYFRNV